VEHASPGIPGVTAGGLISFALANASAKFLLAVVSLVTNMARAKFDVVSCWRTMVLVAATRARLLRAAPRRLMVAVGAGRTAWAPPNGPPPPRCLKLALAFEVGKTEGNLPGSPRAVDGWEALPINYLLQEVLGSKDICRGHHHKFDISSRHASLLCLFLHILHHDNELGDAIRLHIILHHVHAEGDHVHGMQPPTVGIKDGHDVKGRDLHIEQLGILQVVVPNLVDNILEEFGHATFGRLVAGIVIKAGFMGCLGVNMDDNHGIVGNVLVIEGGAGRPDKLGIAMVGFVLGGLHEDGHE
jgi:hypothetical protein